MAFFDTYPTSDIGWSPTRSMSMQNKPAGEGWDFTPVIDLIYLLSADLAIQPSSQPSPPTDPYPPRGVPPDIHCHDSEAQLGNFDRLWTFLGQPLDIPPPTFSTSDNTDVLISAKEVRWRDEVDGVDLEDTPDEDNLPIQLSGLTKKQRKKERRRLRKQQVETSGSTTRHFISSGDESGFEKKSANFVALKASIKKNEQLQRPPQTPTRALKESTKRLFDSLCEVHNIKVNQSDTPTASPYLVTKLQVFSTEVDLEKSATKKSAIWSMLIDRFVDDKKSLTNARALKYAHNASPKGIHIFVDISNILIGFNDALKISRGLPISQRIRRQKLSFHNLSLILERGRLTAKRVVVGSDNFESIQEAKAIGYETSILERVRKAKQIIPRYAKQSRNGYGTSGQSSGSETNAAYGPEKWVEQAVDEILHLKILESVVDAETPSTIVLASGDAAEAEYSQGFLKMVERALQKKWKVELVGFKHNISGAYKNKEFRLRWGQSFKIIELDDFAELLLSVDS